MQAKLLKETHQFVAMELGSVLVVCWKQSATIAALRDLESPTKDMVTRHPEGVAWLVLTSSNAHPEEESFSKESSAQLERYKQHVKAIACVQSNMTLKGKLTTVVLHVIGALSKGIVPTRIVKTIAEAGAWLHRQLTPEMADGMTVDGLCAAVQAIADGYLPKDSPAAQPATRAEA